MKNERVQHLVTRVKGTFNGFTRGQKAVTIVAVIVALVGAVVFYTWASRPSMSPLYSTPLSQTDAASITSSLTSSGTPYTLSPDGSTISVPTDQVAQIRLNLASQGLPADTEESKGWALVQDAPMTSTDEQQRVLIQRATEGELKNAIQKIDTVQEATVHLGLPKDDVFVRDQAAPTASVLVTPKSGQTLSATQVEAIVHLVAASVPKLTSGNVTVTDSSGRLLSSQGTLGAGLGEARLAQQQAVAASVQQKVQAMLDKAVGAGNSSVTVDAAINYDNSTIETNEYIQPAAGAPALQSDTSTERLTGSGQTPVGGVLGPDNIPVPNTSNASSNQNWTKETAKQVQPYGTRRTVTDAATGGLASINVAVMLDQRTTGAINQAQIEELVATAAGVNTDRGDRVTVSRVPFDTTAAAAAAERDRAAAEQQRVDELWTLGKNAGLALLLLLALLIGFRSTRPRRREVEITEEPPAILPELPGGAGAAAAIAAAPAVYELDQEETLPVVEATPVDPQSAARTTARAAIGELVEDNPDEVARLLRGWMAEGNRR